METNGDLSPQEEAELDEWLRAVNQEMLEQMPPFDVMAGIADLERRAAQHEHALAQAAGRAAINPMPWTLVDRTASLHHRVGI